MKPLYCSEGFPFVIMHTNDLHSYFTGTDLNKGLGHYARLSTLIRNKKEELQKQDIPHLLVDAGDFYGGTLFQTIAPQSTLTDFPEYDFFEYNGYHATTLGNHEFDPQDEGFMTMMEKVGRIKNKTSLISTNIKFESNKFQSIKKHILKSKVFQLNHKGKTLRIGVLGLTGPDGCLTSQSNRQNISFVGHNDKNSKKQWKDLYRLIKNEISILKKKKKAELIMLLLHGGEKEDKKLAKKELGIDIIISGHTHQIYHKKIKKTYISQTGSYGQHLGVLPLVYGKKKLLYFPKMKVDFRPVSDNITPDPDYLKEIEHYRELIDQTLAKTPYQFSTPILTPKFLKNKNSLQETGSFIADKVLSSMKRKSSIQFYFTSLSLIRGSFKNGREYQFSEVFKKLPSGTKMNQGQLNFGDPSVSFYLSKKDIFRLINFFELYAGINKHFKPIFSTNLNYQVRKKGIPFINKVHHLKLDGLDYKSWPPLIHVGTNKSLMGYLNFIENKAYGLIKVRPRDSKGEILKKVFNFYGSELYNFIEAAERDF
jgi:5'-nucleotidase / UDP-sugar diphosphatase